MPQEQCYHYQEDLDQLRNITTGSAEYEEMFSELSKLVSDDCGDRNHRDNCDDCVTRCGTKKIRSRLYLKNRY